MKIGVVIYTYNRIEDAKINMEIIHSLWQDSGLFDDIKIVHAFNGKSFWWPGKYLEDKLVIIKNNLSHFEGAANLIDAGVLALYKNYGSKIDYCIVLAADTWLINLEFVHKIIFKMIEDNQYLATCPWGLPERNEFRDVGMATDFFIFNLGWTIKNKMFPLNYSNFRKRYVDFLYYLGQKNIMLEKLAFSRFMTALFNSCHNNNAMLFKINSKINIIKEREPVHLKINKDGFWERRHYWPKIGLITHHEPEVKRKILKRYKDINGQAISKLLQSKNLSYYNK